MTSSHDLARHSIFRPRSIPSATPPSAASPASAARHSTLVRSSTLPNLIHPPAPSSTLSSSPCKRKASALQDGSFDSVSLTHLDLDSSACDHDDRDTSSHSTIDRENTGAYHANSFPVDDERGSTSTVNQPDSEFCLCPPEPKIPRPPNCFMIFRKYHKNKIRAGAPEISSVLGEAWNNLTEEQQRPYKELADAEKRRHAALYPNYKYQPNRKGRRSSTAANASSPTWCSKCSKPTMTSPTTPAYPPGPGAPKPSLPPPQSSAIPPRSNFPLPPLSIMTPTALRRPSTRPPPPAPVHIPPLGHRAIDDRDILPEAKRRRFTQTTYGHVPHSASFSGLSGAAASPSLPYPSPSPYRTSFAPSDPRYAYATAPATGMFPPGSAPLQTSALQPLQAPQATQQPPVNLPRLKMHAPNSKEAAYHKAGINYLVVHGNRRAPLPLQAPPPGQPPFRVRGAFVVVESDDASAINDIMAFLERHLSAHDSHVSIAEGCRGPASPRPHALTEYWALVNEWRAKMPEMIDYLTKPIYKNGTPIDEEVGPADKPETVTPVLLMARYHWYATDAWSTAIAVSDSFTATEHYSWLAMLWRGTIGADLTIHVRDHDMDDADAVEVHPEAHAIFVTKKRKGRVEDKTLRRLAFEVGETIRALSTATGGLQGGEGGGKDRQAAGGERRIS